MKATIKILAEKLLSEPEGCSQEVYDLLVKLLDDDLHSFEIEEDDGRYFLRMEMPDEESAEIDTDDGFDDCPEDPEFDEFEESFEGDEIDRLLDD